jgi:hypothetical protein
MWLAEKTNAIVIVSRAELPSALDWSRAIDVNSDVEVHGVFPIEQTSSCLVIDVLPFVLAASRSFGIIIVRSR